MKLSRHLSFSSLRVRLLLLVLLALAPAFALISYTALEQRRHTTLEVQETALRLARLASHDHERLISGTHQLLVGLAQLQEVRNRERQRCSALFAALLEKYPLYANLGAIEPGGQLFCSAVPTPGPITAADRGYFRRAMETRRFAVGDYQVGRVTGKAAVNVAYPALDETGQVLAVVFAALDLAWFNQFVADAKLPDGSSLIIVDQNGTILVRHPDHAGWVGRAAHDAPLVQRILRQRTGVAEAAGLDGVQSLVGFTPLLAAKNGGDIYVSIGIPSATAFAPATRTLVLNLVALGAVGVLALAAAWLGGHAFVLRQVNTLVSATGRLAAGDLTARSGMAHRGGELNLLAQAFDEMAESLQRDIAERERSQKELQLQREVLLRSEKLADLGRLAAGVDHELRNPLAVISGRMTLLEMQISDDKVPTSEVLARHVRAVTEAVERMERIMRGLSTYSKPSRPEPTLLDMRELLSAIRELVAYQARTSDVTIAIDAPAALPSVLGDRGQLMQVFLNLATNAIEAMAGTGGRLRLGARVEDDATSREPSNTETGASAAWVLVEVADTGPGIPADVLPKIWEAFYTTKPEGTGLGLSIVRALVEEQPGARISVQSEPGRGTVFTLMMPVAG